MAREDETQRFVDVTIPAGQTESPRIDIPAAEVEGPQMRSSGGAFHANVRVEDTGDGGSKLVLDQAPGEPITARVKRRGTA